MMRTAKLTLGVTFVVSAAAVIAGFVLAPEQAANSYLIAYCFVFTTVLGTSMMIAIGHLTSSRWFVLVRRLAEAIVGTLPVLCVLFLPVLFSLGHLYEWVHPETLEPEARHAVEARGSFHTIPMFVVRSVVYLGLATASGEALYLFSRRQDRRDPERTARIMRALSAFLLPVDALVITFVAFDWIMSLEPGWYSNVFGVYIFSGGILSALAWLTVGVAWARRRGVIPREFGMPHFHALGTLMFAFVIFWTYIAYFQYMLIWIGNLPEEIRFYLHRTMGPYEPVAITLVVVHFAIPFALGLFRVLKRHAAPLAGISAIVIVAHYLDLHWVISPVLHPGAPQFGWLDALCLVAVTSAAALAATLRFEHAGPVPEHDPLFEKALSYGGVP